MSDRHFSHEVWLSKLRDYLTEERYAARTSRQCIAVARHFLRCLDKQKVDVSTAQPASVEEYLQQERQMYRRRHGHPPDYKGWQCFQVGTYVATLIVIPFCLSICFPDKLSFASRESCAPGVVTLTEASEFCQ